MTDLKQKIKDALENLVTLEIITSVGTTTVSESGLLDVNYKDDAKVMLSKIDLLQGDVTNSLHEAFVTGDYKELRTFHETQVEKGQKIVEDNVNALKALLNLLPHLDK